MASHAYASRGSFKLAHACDAWALPIAGCVAADFGSSAGGFTDALLARGACRVYAVEKGKGILDWRLRTDARVVVMERTDARTVSLPEPLDLAVIDVGWTVQEQIVPHALSLLKRAGHIVSLLKPHYERSARQHGRSSGRMAPEEGLRTLRETLALLQAKGIIVREWIPAPVLGEKGDNQEFLLHIVKE